MEKRVQQIYEDTFFLYQRLVSFNKWAKVRLIEHNAEMEYCADMAFAMAELDKLIHDSGVEIRRTRELAELLGGRTWLQSPDSEPIRTEHCTATVRTKLQPAMPAKGSPEMAELFAWLGITKNSETVRVHWPSLCDLITKQVEEGKPIPKCIDPEALHNPAFTMQFYKKKDVPK